MIEPVDSDIDLHRPEQRQELLRSPGATLAVVSIGGAVGALARYGLALAWPTPAAGFPWTTFATNVIGCFLIGVLMVVVTEIVTAHPLVRPFLGVGILGGFTTFSTYANETRGLIQPGTVATAFLYMAATLVCALLATLLALRVTRAVYSHRITRAREVSA
ncbi:fluoride efflux transporter CrcB [Nocardia sp. CT2-14]|uniref:Fluoride-specific ion channel FluC n=2 Tax=Nocardia aurantiaca TaxID=2675850 RepID=A0A6I3KY81_9NOCA|nr:fluoride efflux transporter CrcB [Nocardia aurantiaca]